MPGATTPPTPATIAATREPNGEPGRRTPHRQRVLPWLRVLAVAARWLLPDLFPDLGPELVRWFDELTRSSFPE